jgi:CDP-diacylglycerol--serine O-phosphatidyltransferase
MITAFGLSCGLFVIFKMNMLMPGAVDRHAFQVAAQLLLLAALADVLDGAVARLIHAESEFGVQFDSLADAVSFGVVPSVMMIKSLPISEERLLAFGVTASAMVYSICGVLRLARFNVTAGQIKENLTDEEIIAQKKNFTGLPIPAAAAAAVSMNLFLLSNPLEEWGIIIDDEIRSFILIAVMFSLGYFMVSQWKFPSVKMLRWRIQSFEVFFISVVAAVVLFYVIYYHFATVMAILAWSYISVSFVLSLIRRIAGKRVQTLEDFEPDSHDSL